MWRKVEIIRRGREVHRKGILGHIRRAALCVAASSRRRDLHGDGRRARRSQGDVGGLAGRGTSEAVAPPRISQAIVGACPRGSVCCEGYSIPGRRRGGTGAYSDRRGHRIGKGLGCGRRGNHLLTHGHSVLKLGHRPPLLGAGHVRYLGHGFANLPGGVEPLQILSRRACPKSARFGACIPGGRAPDLLADRLLHRIRHRTDVRHATHQIFGGVQLQRDGKLLHSLHLPGVGGTDLLQRHLQHRPRLIPGNGIGVGVDHQFQGSHFQQTVAVRGSVGVGGEGLIDNLVVLVFDGIQIKRRLAG